MAKLNIDKSETLTTWDYDDNGNLIGEHILSYKDRSPISGAWQIPAKCTTIEPPEPVDGYTLFFNKELNSWDYRENKYNINKVLVSKTYDKTLLGKLKREKRKLFKNTRIYIESEKIEYKDYEIDFSSVSRERLYLAEKLLMYNKDNISSINWTAKHSKNIDLTLEDIHNIMCIAAIRSDKLHRVYKKLEKILAEASTIEEVYDINWPVNIDEFLK